MSDDNVQVKFGADTSDFQVGLNSIKDSFAGLSSFTQGMMESFTGIGEAIGAAFAVDKLIGFAEKMGEIGEQVGRTSAMTGLATKSVIDFQYAVNMMGGDGDAAAASLRILERNMGQAQAGSEKAATSLKDAGVSMKTIASGNINDALGEIATHFSETANGVNKTTIAFEAMGRGGSTLIPVLDLGSDGLKAIYVEADRVNSVLEKNAEKFAQTGQAIKTADSATSNYTQALYTALEPAINAVVKTWDAWMTELTKSTEGGNLLTATITLLGDAFEAVLVVIDAVITAIEQVWDIGEGIIKGLVSGLEGVAVVLQDIGSLNWSQAVSDASTYGKKIGDDISAGFDKANKAGADFLVRTKSAWDTLNGAQVGVPAKKDDTPKPPPKLTPDKPKDDKQKNVQDGEEQRQIYAENYSVKKEYDDLAVQSGEMTRAQEFADLHTQLDKEHELIAASFSQEEAFYKADAIKYKELMDQKTAAATKAAQDYAANAAKYQQLLDKQNLSDQKYTIEKMKLDQQASADSMKVWTSAFSTIEHTFDAMMTGVLQGTQTIGQAFARMAQNLALQFTLAAAKVMAENALLVVSQDEGWTKMSAALAKSLGEWNMTEAAKTGATVTANTVRTASDTAAAAAGETAQASATSAEITKDAGGAAAGVYNSVAQIPYVGWILAPIAAGAAFAAVSAYDSFDVGTPNVPKDMLAQIHQGEAIVPAKTAKAWREGDTDALGNSGGGGHTHFHISSMDSQGVAKLLKQHGAAIAAGVASAARGGNGGLRTALGRM